MTHEDTWIAICAADPGATWQTEHDYLLFHAVAGAHENADNTAREEGFEYGSERWLEIAVSSFDALADDYGVSLPVTSEEAGTAR